MSILLLIIACILLIFIGKWLFEKWFNHISLYTIVWGLTLILFEFKFINYYPLESDTWMIIISSWILFLIGSITVVATRITSDYKRIHINHEKETVYLTDELKRLKNILWCLNSITLAAAIYDFYLVSKLFGGLSNALILGNVLYSHRVSEGLPGSIPYIGSLVFTATIIAGSYTAKLGRITLVAILPIIIIVLIDFANMGRADILIVAILFTSSYLVMSTQQKENSNKLKLKFRKFAIFALLIIIVVAGAEIIRSTRKAREGFTGSTRSLQKLSTASIITPSIYLYLSVHHGVFNQYLRHGGEHTPMGGNTFLPLFRLFEKFGADIHANTYQGWYKTPTQANTGTYLRELHGDFGIVGLLFGPYLLGLFSSIFWYRFKDYRKYTDLSILTFLYGIIGLSYFVIATRISGFFFFLFVSIITGYYIDKKSNFKVKNQ